MVSVKDGGQRRTALQVQGPKHRPQGPKTNRLLSWSTYAGPAHLCLILRMRLWWPPIRKRANTPAGSYIFMLGKARSTSGPPSALEGQFSLARSRARSVSSQGTVLGSILTLARLVSPNPLGFQRSTWPRLEFRKDVYDLRIFSYIFMVAIQYQTPQPHTTQIPCQRRLSLPSKCLYLYIKFAVRYDLYFGFP